MRKLTLAASLLLAAGSSLALQPTPTPPPVPQPQPPAPPVPQPTPKPVPQPDAKDKPKGDAAPREDKKDEKKDDKAWNVANPPSDNTAGGWQWKDVALSTDEGTWMSVDVSPDGQTIVFDLMGDLYTMPIAGSADGSQVKCIAEGVQWDMQPRFSPDGKWIAFVSDRTGDSGKGGDNIWIMKPDGSGLRQITKESFRLMTQPVWSADSQNIIARKHFTSRRSLGAGEMWMFHVSGKSDGFQLTAKTSEQKDTGEPATSRDGRYLYYSLDTAPGGGFEYDKDSNPGIYSVDRLDLLEQKTERIVSGPGGACRPVPSPDGTKLAFVRRVRYQTCLFVMDLKSGQTTQIYDKLERDNQETWAVHGVYPAMAWTPDNKSIVLYAKGKIRKLDVASHQAQVIPFRVTNPRKIAEAIRFPVDVAPATFTAKMLQHVTVSPKGDKVLFTAVGHLYTADYASGKVGEPKRLTTAKDEFEFYPAWSPDGSQVIYVAWNDERLAAVKIVNATGAEASWTVTREPGHYTDPCFAPDGERIAYSKGSGGYITSPLWGRDTGVYAGYNPSRFRGEAPPSVRVSTRGGNPQFSADSTRLYLTARDGGSDSDKVSLISVPVGGVTPGDGERTLARSDWATEFKVSPDGKWIAFVERFNVYAAPFPVLGKPVDLGPRTSNLPLVKLSSQAGNFLHWSGDSTALHWALGPDLYTQAVAPALLAGGWQEAAEPSADGKPASKPEAPKATSTPITLTINADVPVNAAGERSSIAITNVKIATMRDTPGSTDIAQRGMEVIPDGIIVVAGNRIIAVGPAASTPIPAGATLIDGKGGTVTPGWVDVHAHGPQGENGFIPQKNWSAQANLAFGVTTIHDPSNDTENFFTAAEIARSGAILTPRLFSTGTILYGAQGAYKAEVESLDDALFHLGRMKAVGAVSVKSYNQPRRDQRQMVLEAARRLGMMVVPEGGALYHHNMTMVVDGHTTVEHTMPNEVSYKDALTLWGASRTGYSPTLLVAYGGMGGENYWYAKTNAWENPMMNRFVPRFILDPRSRRRTDAPDGDWNHIKESAMAKAILEAKQANINREPLVARLSEPGSSEPASPSVAPLSERRSYSRGGFGPALGAHGQLAGLGPHWETWSLVQGGMTPLEALRAVTLDSAAQVGMDKDIGAIAPGKLADLNIYAKDPTADIRNTESIQMVMLNGRVYSAADLSQIAPAKVDAPHYFFEALQQGAGTPLALEAIMQTAARNGGLCTGCGRQH